ncbi:MAG: hypothetical protein LBG06_01555 [Deltaproteobacteria bacterium]|jgi:hypothetical protein|nr:hypothetical protein [Deltaproteobacteria bacterium]
MLPVRLEPDADGERIYCLLTRDTLRNTPAHLKDRHPWLREVDGMAL